MPSPGQKIFVAESESLYDFVSKNGRGLYIPPYQRDYAWDKSNVERLIDDITQGLSALLKRPDESITFIGTIIAMNDARKVTISPLIKNQVYSQVMTIIDGQQRLTTLLMLCLSMYLELEVQWAELQKIKDTECQETKEWLETKINNTRGLLSQMLSEKQNNGEAEYRYFPKMIRAFVDQWSYETDKAKYESPISWLIFEFIKFKEQENPVWSKFPAYLKVSAESSDSQTERKHLLNMVRVMRKRLESLQEDDDFPIMLEIVQDKTKQDTLFSEEFPESMQKGLEEELRKKDEDSNKNDKLRRWWRSVSDVTSLLYFSQFALDRITLVVVTATTEDFAFDVFEALNTTGQPLTAIETFTPKVVQAVGLSNYSASDEKKQIEIAFNYVKKANRADERQKRSADLLVAFALAESGDKRSKNLADQRRFMRETFDQYKSRPKQLEFIKHLADLSLFFDSVWISSDTKPIISGQIIPDPCALCLRFLVDFGHTITAPLLSQYASAIGSAKSISEKQAAVSDFSEVVLAVTAFTVMWRASRDTTDRIDQIYREIMSKGVGKLPALARGLRVNSALPKPSEIKSALLERLYLPRAAGGGNIKSKDDWIEKVILQPVWDINTDLARFILLIAFHDAVENETGQLIVGKPGSMPTLTLDAWAGGKYATVEHIAPRTKSAGWSGDLYQNDEIERLGNLTLIPQRANSSLSNRSWQQKRLLFSALAAETEGKASAVLDELKELGIDVSNTAQKIYVGEYLPHVNVLSKVNGEWNLESINQRGRSLAELVWNRVGPWLEAT